MAIPSHCDNIWKGTTKFQHKNLVKRQIFWIVWIISTAFHRAKMAIYILASLFRINIFLRADEREKNGNWNKTTLLSIYWNVSHIKWSSSMSFATYYINFKRIICVFYVFQALKVGRFEIETFGDINILKHFNRDGQ